jgi:hypothetical protein
MAELLTESRLRAGRWGPSIGNPTSYNTARLAAMAGRAVMGTGERPFRFGDLRVSLSPWERAGVRVE